MLPDGRTAARVDAALTVLLGEGRHALLTAESGPEKRYRQWLAVHRGSVRAVIGTRAAMFAPVRDLGLVAVWDDGDSSHSDDNAPFPHVREVLELRAVNDGCGFLAGSTSCTVEAAQLVESGWASPLIADRETVRACAPRIRTVGDELLARDEAARAARLPSLAWETVREGLKTGPVLVQVPRRGYVPRLACERCRTPARCTVCAGPLEAPDERDLKCGWCGRGEPSWHCEECGSFRLRAQVVGARRTAEELGRAFPAVAVRTSGRDHVLDEVPDRPALVVCTPGAEPVAAGAGYAAALLLDGWAMLTRPDLRAGEDALRRWIAAASLVRGDGQVVVVAEPTLRPVQALVRWDPVGHAVRELAERSQLGFPGLQDGGGGRPGRGRGGLPGRSRTAARRGDPGAGAAPRAARRAVPGERALVRVPPGSGAALAAALKSAQAARLAKGFRRRRPSGSGSTHPTSAEAAAPTRCAPGRRRTPKPPVGRPVRSSHRGRTQARRAGAAGRRVSASRRQDSRQPLRGPGKAGERGASASPRPGTAPAAAAWASSRTGCGGIERAAGTVGSGPRVRVVVPSAGGSADSADWARRAP